MANRLIKRDPLTPRQERFVEEYLVDLNGTQAAVRAGYSPKTAQEQASRLLSKVKVSVAVVKAMEERSRELKVDATWVLMELIDVYKTARDKKRSKVGKLELAKSTLDSIGKHVDIKAFVERIEAELGCDLAERMRKANKALSARRKKSKQKCLTLSAGRKTI